LSPFGKLEIGVFEPVSCKNTLWAKTKTAIKNGRK